MPKEDEGLRFLDEAPEQDSGLRFLDDAPEVQEPEKDPNYLESFLDFAKKSLQQRHERQRQQQAEEQQAQQEQEAIRNDPRNMSSTQIKKVAPKPQTLEEQATLDATIARKKAEEQQMQNDLLPDDLKKKSVDIKGPSDDVKHVPAALGAGLASGGLSILESVLRTPDAVGRALGGIGEIIGAEKTKEQFDAIMGPLTEGFELKRSGVDVPGLNDYADHVHVFQAALAQNRPSFKRNALIGQQADKAFDELLKGDPREFYDVVTNPVAWSGAIGQAVPSLATMYITGGSTGVMMWLEAMGSAIDAKDFENQTGVEVSNQEFARAVIQAGTINGMLEKIGFNKIFGKSKPVQGMLKKGVSEISGKLTPPAFLRKVGSSAVWEGVTEALQEFNSNAASRSFDKDAKLTEGLLMSAMGGFGAGAGAGAASISSKEVARRQARAILNTEEIQAEQRAKEAPQKPTESKPKPSEPQKPTDVSEGQAISILEGTGAKFRGIQKGFKRKSGEIEEDRILFDEPSGSTLALKKSEFTKENIKKKMEGFKQKDIAAKKKEASIAAPAAEGKADPLIEEAKKYKTAEEFVRNAFTIKPPRRIYRGVMNDGKGAGTASLGKGLYSTPDKYYLKRPGLKFDKIIELSAEQAFPRNPIVFNSSGEFTDWLIDEGGFRNIREFNARYKDPSVFVKSRGFDGVVVKGQEIVKYDNSLSESGLRKIWNKANLRKPALSRAIKQPQSLPEQKRLENVREDAFVQGDEFPAPKDPTNRPSLPEEGKTYGPHEQPMRSEKPAGEIKGTNETAIIKQLSQVAQSFGGKTPIRVGRYGGFKRGVLGVHFVKEEVIRLKTANDIFTAAHELGHAVEKIVLGYPKGSPWKKPLIDAKMQKELANLGKILYGDKQPNGGYKREGFAEFTKLYLANRRQAKRQAPLFYKWFESEFLKDFPQAVTEIEKASDLFKRWQEQGAVARAKESFVDKGSVGEIVKRIKESTAQFLSFEQHVDMIRPLYKVAREAERKLGRKLSEQDDPYTVAAALRTTHDARVGYMVDDAMIDLAGNPVGPSLAEIRPLVKGRKDDFVVYLWAKRAKALWNDPKGARNPGLTEQDADQIIQELDSVNFNLAAQKVYDWNDGVLNYAAQASLTFAEVVSKIRNTDPGFYIPLNRAFEDLDSSYVQAKSGKGRASTGQLVKRLRGSGRRIVDPFPQMIANARATVLAAHNRMVLDTVIRLSNIEGMGHIIEKVPKDQVPAAHQTVGDVIKALNKKLNPEAGVAVGGEVSEDVLGQSITFFTPAQFPKGQDPIFPIYADGKLNWYQLDGELYNTLQAMEVYRLPTIGAFPLLDWMFGKPTRIFRAGTTGLRAAFGLITNPLRDIQTMYLNSQSNVNGFQLFHAWMQSMSEALLFKTTGDTSTYLDAFIRIGGEMAQPLGQDIPHTRRAAKTLFQGKVVRTLDPRNWFDFLREFLQFPESAARTAELRTLAKDIGWEPGQPMTMNQSLRLLLAAKQVTTDFTAMGEFARVMNQIVPFYNAAIQGPRANIRAAMRNPRKFVARGLSITAATLAYWWANKDEEFYRELNAKDKFLFWYFPVTKTDKDGNPRTELIRIPRAFEVGQIFASMPEAFIDSWYRQDPQAVKDWWVVFSDITRPNTTPVLLDEVLDQVGNRDRFWDSPIVNQSLSKRPSAEQYDEFTSSAAITMGRIFDVSPKRVDHAIRGLFGSVAGDVLELLGVGPRGVDREPESADIPVLGTLFKRGGKFGTRPRAINDLYDLYGEAVQKQYSIRNPENDKERDLRLMLKDATQAISAMSYVRTNTKETEARRELMQEEIKLAREAMDLYKKGEVVRVDFRVSRKEFKRQKKEIQERKIDEQRKS